MAKRLTDAERTFRDLSERDFQRHYVAVLRSLGFLVAHHYDSRFSDPGTKGVPDLTVVGHGVFLLIELKRESGKVSDEQHQWHEQLNKADIITMVCRPSDWESMMMYAEAIARADVAPGLRQPPKPIKRPKKKRSGKPSSE